MQKQLTFALLVAALFTWGLFVYPIVVQAVYYFRYTATVAPDEISWQVNKVHDELWKLEAKYRYTVAGKSYKIDELFQGEQFRNPYAAESALKQFEKEKTIVWYPPNKPFQGTIEKFFPVKKVIYAVITFLLILYAAWLANYISTYLLKREG